MKLMNGNVCGIWSVMRTPVRQVAARVVRPLANDFMTRYKAPDPQRLLGGNNK